MAHQDDNKINIYALLGVAGVSTNENKIAQRSGKLLDWPMILLAIWILFSWHLQNKGLISPEYIWYTDILVWIFFVFEFVLLISLVKNKLYYAKSNWLNLVIILVGMQILWNGLSYMPVLRIARLFIMFIIFLSILETVVDILSKNKLSSTLFIGLVFTFIVGTLISGFDPGVDSIGDGIWWAWVTVTTVGYGDIVPQSTLGRILGGIVMLIGILLISLITASFSAYLMERREIKILRGEKKTMSELHKIEAQLDQIQKQLDNIQKKI